MTDIHNNKNTENHGNRSDSVRGRGRIGGYRNTLPAMGDSNNNNNNNNCISNSNSNNSNSNNSNNNNNNSNSNSVSIYSKTNSNSNSVASSNLSTTSNDPTYNYKRLIDYYIVCGLNNSLVPNQIERPYQAEVLDRYPLSNHDNAPLPSHIWMFCFPSGLMLRETSLDPSLSMFCLTEFDGARFYAVSLIYYLPIPKDRHETNNKTLFKPVSISLLSRFPCYEILKQLLCYLYKATNTPGLKLSVPYERIITNIIQDLPRPIAGYKIQINLPSIYPQQRFEYSLTNRHNFPQLDIPFQVLFNCIGVHSVLKLFELALHERKILFISASDSLLTMACETLSYLLYPFVWPHVFIPILPNILGDFLQAPTPLIVGTHISEKQLMELNNDIVIVNLDTSAITIPPSVTAPSLPEKEGKILINRLKSILYPEMLHFSVALDPNVDQDNSEVESLDKSTRIRAAFLDFFLTFFHDVHRYRYLLRKYPKPITSFNTASFLMKYNRTEVINFLTGLIETSAVTSFLEQNISKKDFFFFISKQHRVDLISNPKATFYDTIIKYMIKSSNISKLPDELEIIGTPAPDSESLPNNTEGYTYTQTPNEMVETLFSNRTHFSVTVSNNYKPKPPPIEYQQHRHHTLPTNINPLLETSSTLTSSLQQSPDNNNQNSTQNNTQSNNRKSSFLRTNSTVVLANQKSNISITSNSLNGDHELLKEFIERYTELIFDQSTTTSSVDREQQNLLLNLFTLTQSRMFFIESLTSPKKSFVFASNWKLYLMVDILKRIFIECDSSADFKTAAILLTRIKEFYYVGSDIHSHEPLYNLLVNVALWRNIHFWNSYFFYSVTLERKDKLTPTYNDYMFDDWDQHTISQQSSLMENEEDILFTTLSTFAFLMIKLKVSTSETSRFIGNMSQLTSISEQHTNTLCELVDRLYRVNNIDAPVNDTVQNVDTNFIKSDIKYFTSSLRRNIEMEKHGAKQIYTKLLENKRKAEKAAKIDKDLIFDVPTTTYNNSNNNNNHYITFEPLLEKRDGYSVTTLKGDVFGVSCVAVHNKPKCILGGDNGGNIMVWNYETGDFQQKLSNHKDAVNCIGIGDYDVFASGSRDKTLRIWNHVQDTGLWQCTSTLQEHTAEITCMEIKRNTILTGSYDSTVVMWDVRTNRRVKTLTGHVQHILSLAMTPDGQMAVSTSSDTTARVWDLRTLKCMRILNGHNDWVTSGIWGATSSTLFTGGFDCIVNMWDVNSGEVVRSFNGHAGGINCLSYHNNTLISGSGDGFLKSWDINTGFSIKSFKGHRDEILSVLCEEDLMVTSSNDQTIRTWSLSTGLCQKVLRGHSDWIKCLAAPKHQSSLNRFVSASWDSTVKIWELDTNTQNPLNTSTGSVALNSSLGTSPGGPSLSSSQSLLSRGSSVNQLKKSPSNLNNSGGMPISNANNNSNDTTRRYIKKSQLNLKSSLALFSGSNNSHSSNNNNNQNNNNIMTQSLPLSLSSSTSLSSMSSLSPSNSSSIESSISTNTTSSDSSSSSSSNFTTSTGFKFIPIVPESQIRKPLPPIPIQSSNTSGMSELSMSSSSISSSGGLSNNTSPTSSSLGGWQFGSPSNRSRRESSVIDKSNIPL